MLQYSTLFITQWLHRVWLFAASWTRASQASLSFTIPQSLPSSHPQNWWCHPTISSCVAAFSSCPQSFPAPASLPMSQLFTAGGQSIGVSASASVLPMNTQGWFPLGWTGWISLQSKRLSRVFSSTTVWKHQFVNWCSAFFTVQLSYPYMTTGKNIALTTRTFVGKVMSLLFNMLSRFFRDFFPRSKCLFISWLQLPFTVTLELKKIKPAAASTFSPPICHEVMEPDAMILIFWMLSFKPAFSVSSFTLIKRLFSSSSLSAIRVASSAYLRLLIFLPHEQYEKAKSFLPKMSIYFFNFTSGNRNFLEQFWIGTAIHFLKKIKRNLVLCIHNVEKWN